MARGFVRGHVPPGASLRQTPTRRNAGSIPLAVLDSVLILTAVLAMVEKWQA